MWAIHVPIPSEGSGNRIQDYFMLVSKVVITFYNSLAQNLRLLLLDLDWLDQTSSGKTFKHFSFLLQKC